ncbi:site-specific DNA-methyltransferase [Candidatus Saccharibacteria bacterium]|jgi:DNA modification methylase|nr:site-specific DNA-methyltransferase [Candidatus Saccharibacteria bacterium]
MPEDKQHKVSKIKGRAMLHWVGKKPLDLVQSYPAQLVETVNGKETTLNYASLKKDWQNLLFHGDNKEVLSTLIVNGFRGKVDLIYIDPPFDSGADYVRKVELRGSKEKVAGEDQSVLEQTQYTDIWANDNYLQFMYERLILLRELLSDKGTLYLHCDWHKSHQLRFLMDEVFGAEKFHSEIIWSYQTRQFSRKYWNRKHDTILAYSKGETNIFNVDDVLTALSESTIKKYKLVDEDGMRYRLNGRGITDSPIRSAKDVDPKWEISNPELVVRDHIREGFPPDAVWQIGIVNQAATERTDYPTQKPEELLDRIIKASTNKDSIVLDCFMGSGTTAAVAQKLGRKWIGADINKGAIQTTMKRLQKIVDKQAADKKPAISSILNFRVNNYDFQKIHELKGIIIEKYDVTPVKTDGHFDGTVGERLVKIAELNQPVNKLTVQGVLDELKNREEETRNILIIGSGVELGVDQMIVNHNKTHPVNKIEVKDLQSDGIIVHDPAEADVEIKKSGDKVNININNYLSPTIIKRLDIDRSIFGEKIKDFRSQIDVVVIDTDYDGKTFNIVHSDVPEKKSDLIVGKYELDLLTPISKVAVKIIDMLGEEMLVIG